MLVDDRHRVLVTVANGAGRLRPRALGGFVEGGLYADPSKNLVTDAHVNIETALTIVTAFGFKVDV